MSDSSGTEIPISIVLLALFLLSVGLSFVLSRLLWRKSGSLTEYGSTRSLGSSGAYEKITYVDIGRRRHRSIVTAEYLGDVLRNLLGAEVVIWTKRCVGQKTLFGVGSSDRTERMPIGFFLRMAIATVGLLVLVILGLESTWQEGVEFSRQRWYASGLAVLAYYLAYDLLTTVGLFSVVAIRSLTHRAPKLEVARADDR